MLFQRRFHAGLRNGTTTETFRRWKQLQVKVGGRYRVHGVGELVVEAIAVVTKTKITEAASRRAGFEDRDELLRYLDRKSSGDGTLYRVTFRVEATTPMASPPGPLAEEELQELRARLDRMDRLGRAGPWTRQVLRLIARNPRCASSELAPEIGMERLVFKRNVRKLKNLGLTTSHSVGYVLSPWGRQVLGD